MGYNFLVDSHCHLDLIDDKGSDIASVIKDANDNGIRFIQTISTRISKIDRIVSIANKYSGVSASIGVHPNNVTGEGIYSVNEIVQIAKQNPRINSVGETGLDYYYENSPRDLQIQSFENHIKAAIELNFPIIVHSRNAETDTYDIMKNYPSGKFLLHCFTSSREFAFKSLDLGAHISIAGIVTFKNAVELQDLVRNIPLEKLLIETDSPYLAPEPMRGSSNQPAFVKYVCQKIARIKEVDFEIIARQTTKNYIDLFKYNL